MATIDLDEQIRDRYRRYLGRDPGADEVAIHRGNPGGIEGVGATIASSDEYQNLLRSRGLNEGGTALQGYSPPSSGGGSSAPPPASAFDPSRVPAGIPRDWAENFIRGNRDDYHRLSDAWASELRGRMAPSAPAPQSRPASSGPPSDAGQVRAMWNPSAQMFTDPGTSQLERLLNAQLEALNRPNPQLQQLMDFLNKQFTEISQNPGYAPEELALLRTQAFEPVEQQRQATQRRALERTAARGFLPSSGLSLEESRDIDTDFDRMRTALDRDLAINAINQRRSRLGDALQMARAAYEIPTSDERTRFSDQLTRSSLLAELPDRALNRALSVLGATPGPESLFSQAIQLQGLQQNRAFLDQQRNMQTWGAIGNMIPQLLDLFT